MTPQPNRYQTVKQAPDGSSLNFQGLSDAEQKIMGCTSPPLSKEVRDILDDLQNN